MDFKPMVGQRCLLIYVEAGIGGLSLGASFWATARQLIHGSGGGYVEKICKLFMRVDDQAVQVAQVHWTGQEGGFFRGRSSRGTNKKPLVWCCCKSSPPLLFEREIVCGCGASARSFLLACWRLCLPRLFFISRWNNCHWGRKKKKKKSIFVAESVAFELPASIRTWLWIQWIMPQTRTQTFQNFLQEAYDDIGTRLCSAKHLW